MSNVASFIWLLWTEICSIEVLNLGFSFGALFVTIFLIDISISIFFFRFGKKGGK